MPGAVRPGLNNLQPQDLTLTILGAYVLPRRQALWSGGLVRLLADFDFSSLSARAALSRLARRGLLARQKRGRRSYYALTERSERLLAEGDRRILSFGADTWDGSWTLLSYSIPAAQRVGRDRLRARLSFLGFWPLHDATWIAPRNREEEVWPLLDELGLDRHAELFIGRPSRHLKAEQLLPQAADLSSLASRYETFIARFGPQRRAVGLSDREAFLTRVQMIHEFRRFPLLDPELPEEVLPGRIRRSEAIATFHDVYTKLADPSNRYFDRTVADD